MKRLEISVPDKNDSFSRVVLGGTPYFIRFTWNAMAKRWSFGLFTSQREPIVQGLRLIPRFPLNLQNVDVRLPKGIFGVYTDRAEVGRDDFCSGSAIFAFVAQTQEA